MHFLLHHYHVFSLYTCIPSTSAQSSTIKNDCETEWVRPQLHLLQPDFEIFITLSPGVPQGCVLSPLLFGLLTHTHYVKFLRVIQLCWN